MAGTTCNHCGGLGKVVVNGREVACGPCHGSGEVNHTK